MYIITIASQKGGVGKTTLAGHLAVEGERSGCGPAIMIDADPQGSLTAWWRDRKADRPALAEMDAAALIPASMSKLRDGGYRLVVIDTPPATTATIRAAIALADLVLIPTLPSPHDLRAVGATVAMVQAKKRPFAFVVNGAVHRAKITQDANRALSMHGSVCPTTIMRRTDFASSMIDGLTVGETDAESKSAAEIAALWMYVHAYVNRDARK